MPSPRTIKLTLTALLLAIASATAAQAQTFRQTTKVDIRIGADLSVEEIVHVETTPLVQGAVNNAALARWNVVDGQQAELLEAFTRKADGQTVPADVKDLVTQDGVVGQAMSYIDQKIHQLPFRDVAVGDTTVFKVRYVERSHFIPGHISRARAIPPFGAQRSIDVTLRAPATMRLHHDETDVAYEERREGGDIIRHWTASPAYLAVEENNVANLARKVPSLRFSTFESYEAIAAAYDSGARPKTVVSEEVQRLAAEITRDKADVRAQSEAIFNWVSRNIRYVAVYFGNGRYVPNDTTTILSRRFGDCKDHATLMVALLAARGIAAEQVLIGTDPNYQLAITPTLQAFNHVIVYIPALDTYVDPTIQFGTFARLPMGAVGKPVLRVSAQRPVLARTPLPSVDDNVVELTTRVTVADDGRRQGYTTIDARGEFVDTLRTFVAQSENRGKDLVLRDLAKQRGVSGQFDLEATPWTLAGNRYSITTRWDRSETYDLVANGMGPPAGFSPIFVSPSLFFGTIERSKRIFPAVCRAGRAVHSFDIALPKGVAPIRLPAPVSSSTADFSYRAEWSSEGTHLKFRAEVVASPKDRVCSPEQIDAVRAAYWSIDTRLRTTVRFNKDGQPAIATGPAVEPAPAPSQPALATEPAPWSGDRR